MYFVRVFFSRMKKKHRHLFFLSLSAVFLSDPSHIFCHSHCNLFQLCIHNLLAICFRIDICGKTLFDCIFKMCSTLATLKMNNIRIDCPLKNELFTAHKSRTMMYECLCVYACSKMGLIFEFFFLTTNNN